MLASQDHGNGQALSPTDTSSDVSQASEDKTVIGEEEKGIMVFQWMLVD